VPTLEGHFGHFHSALSAATAALQSEATLIRSPADRRISEHNEHAAHRKQVDRLQVLLSRKGNLRVSCESSDIEWSPA
jgi:hypothetical protein